MNIIKVKISKLKESTIGAWLYTYFVTFPDNPTWNYMMKATEEGWMHTTSIWKKAGYTIEYLEHEPA